MQFPLEPVPIQPRPLVGEEAGHFGFAVKLAAFTCLYVVAAIPAYAAGMHPPSIWTSSLLLGGVSVLLSVIDVESQRLPNLLTLPLALMGLLLCAYFHWDNVWLRLLAAVAAYLLLFGVSAFYVRFRGRQGLGLGDAKLLAASGAWLGFDGVPAVLFIASVTALCGALLAHLFGTRISFSTRIPFGPFLAFGAWLVWLYGPLVS